MMYIDIPLKSGVSYVQKPISSFRSMGCGNSENMKLVWGVMQFLFSNSTKQRQWTTSLKYIKITLANLCFLTCQEPVADVEGKGPQVNTVRVGSWESHWKSKTPQQLAD